MFSITVDDIKVSGNDFVGKEERIKLSIASILSQDSVWDWEDALDMIGKKSEQLIGKQVSAVSVDTRDDHSTFSLYSESSITFAVKQNLDIFLFTTED